jgi:hypothetical protein
MVIDVLQQQPRREIFVQCGSHRFRRRKDIAQRLEIQASEQLPRQHHHHEWNRAEKNRPPARFPGADRRQVGARLQVLRDQFLRHKVAP